MRDDPAGIDELFAVPLEEFTARRNELAKTLAAAGDKGAAKEVKALAKPTAPAWTLNQLARRDPLGIDALLDAGERLRAAQRGEGGDLRSLHAEVRDRVAKLLAEAQTITEESGRQATQALKNRLLQSLMAAAAQEETGAALRTARLSREPEPGGFDTAASDAFAWAPAEADTSPRRKDAEAKAETLRQEAETAVAEADTLAKEAARAEAAAQRARARAEDAAAAAETKRARAEAAVRALEKA